MLYSPAFSFSSGYPLGVLPCAGLRLGVLRQFQAFLASSACAACASSYHFSSIASPPWRSAFCGLRPSSIWGFPFWLLGLTVQSSRPAFGGLLSFVSLRKTRFIQPHVLFTGIYLFKRLFVGFWVSCPGFAFWCRASFKHFLQALRRLRGALLFHGLRSSSIWASRFGFWV